MSGRPKVDPLGPLAVLISLVIFLAHGFEGILTRDLALYAYGGQQAADGVPPYVSVLNRAGPLAHLVPALGVLGGRVVGMDELFAIRLLMMVLSLACVWLLYLYARDLLSSRLAGLAAVGALLVCQAFVGYATGGPREKTTLLLCLLVALWAMLKQRWGVAGIFVALATLTWQPVLVVGCAVALVSMTALRGRAFFVAGLRFGLGGLVTAALFALGFALSGAFEELIDAFFLINLEYTYQDGLRTMTVAEWQEVKDGFGPGFWVVVVGLVAILATAALRLTRSFRERSAADMAVVAAGVGALVGVLWSFRAFNGFADAFPMLPFAAAGIAAALTAVRTRLPGRAGETVVGAACVVAVAVALGNSIATRDHRLAEQRAEVAAVFEAAGPEATVLSVGGPQPLVLTGRTNPIRHQMFLTGLQDYVDDTYPGGLAGLATWVKSEQPTFITTDHPTWYTWLAPTLAEDYVSIGESPDWTWYVHRSVGQDMLSELHQATS